jgi:hemerythrin-like metal-binding protein
MLSFAALFHVQDLPTGARMPLLSWNDDHAVGVPAMDDEHKRLYQAINELYAAVLEGEERGVTAHLLREVVHCTRQHFSSEEAILAASHYPELPEHSVQHQQLLAQVEELLGRHEQDGLTLTSKSLSFLRYWFDAHIHEDDQLYGAWLDAHEVA